jgi:hypothetical protein
MTSREAAARLRERGLSFRLIGLELGVSKERARQLLISQTPRLCPGCGKPMPAGTGKRRYCRAPCLPPSAVQPPTGRPVGRPKNPELAGPPKPPKPPGSRGRPRKQREQPG